MKKLKKFMRLSMLVLMIFLASFGVGIAGAPPVLPKGREEINEAKLSSKEVEIPGESSSELGS